MPMEPDALDLLKETGPMAVSSANRSGRAAAHRVEEAVEQFGDEVSVYLDGGERDSPTPSTIVDLTYAVPRVLRSGAITIEQLRAVCGTVIGELRKPQRKPKVEGSRSGETATTDEQATEPETSGEGDVPTADPQAGRAPDGDRSDN